MKPESAVYLVKADEALDQGRQILAIAIPQQAGRLACYAAFHAAQALIFERTGRAAKTHKGVKAQFARIALAEGIPTNLPEFLGTGYHLKSAADYETGAGAIITAAEAAGAFSMAEAFVADIKQWLTQPGVGPISQ